MAQSEKTATLVRLSDSKLTVADPAMDIRGRAVIDRSREEIGDVSDLLIDEHDRRVRFLEVASGGFLGLGKTTFLIPVDAVTSVTAKEVCVNQTRQHIAGAPHYDPTLVHEDVGEGSYYGNVYKHYGYSPYWDTGYVYPRYPHYR
jgi:sporulation protein YlmC with PRC-barrel domain